MTNPLKYQCEHCEQNEYWFKYASTMDNVKLCNNCYQYGNVLSRDKLYSYRQFKLLLEHQEMFETCKLTYLKQLRRVLYLRCEKADKLDTVTAYFDNDKRIKEKHLKVFLLEIRKLEEIVCENTYLKDRNVVNKTELLTVYNMILNKLLKEGVTKDTPAYHIDSDVIMRLYDDNNKKGRA